MLSLVAVKIIILLLILILSFVISKCKNSSPSKNKKKKICNLVDERRMVRERNEKKWRKGALLTQLSANRIFASLWRLL